MKLVFHNPLGLFGRFTTTRLAETLEWPEAGTECELYGPDDKLIGIAEVKDAWLGDLAVIPASILEMEQNPLHRTYSGLIMGMRTCGVGKWVSPETKVMCLILDFKRPSKIIR